jgi:hypothetical protein
MVGQNSALHIKLISTFHSSALGGHSGIQATYHRLKKMFSWNGLKQDVESLLGNLQSASKPSMSFASIQGYCSLCLFLLKHGLIFLWILLRVFPPLMASQ